MSQETPPTAPQDAPASEGPPLSGDLPHRPADDREQVYFEGSPLLRGELGMVCIWWLIGLALIAVPIAITGLGGESPAWLWMALILLGILFIAIPIIILKRVRYRITNYRIDFERGLLSKRIDTLELWHVDDIRFYQNLLNRILRVGQITIISNDATSPQLKLMAVPDPRPLFEMLKQRVIAVKRQRGVIKMDLGGAGA